MNAYSVTVVDVSMMEESSVSTKVFGSKEKAEEYLNKKINKFKAEITKMEIDDPNFDIEKWIKENLSINVENDNYVYQHYIYYEGEEKIFELMRHEIEVK